MFKGIIPAFVTPLKDDGSIWRDAAEKALDFELAQGADGFYICGATGEGLVLQPQARMDLAEIVVRHLNGRAACISHIAAIDLKTTLMLARQAEAAGCDAIAAIPPIYFNYGEDDIYQYYKAIGDAVHIPVMIYYHPAAGVNLSAEFMARLFQIENVTSVKWSKPDYFQMLLCKELTHGEMNILNGPDETLLCGLAAGADGGIGTSYNFLLPQARRLYQAFQAGQMAQARQMQAEIDRILTVVLKRPVIPATKEIMRLVGMDVGYATYPMHRFAPGEVETLIRDLRAAGFPA